jgi:hypothetical protein
MNYTPPITALSEMTEKIVSIRKYYHQQSPQTADLGYFLFPLCGHRCVFLRGDFSKKKEKTTSCLVPV